MLGGLFSAVAATVISAAFITLFFAAPTRAFGSAREEGLRFLIICLFMAIPAGSFGMLAGLAGAAWLSVRAKHFRSTAHLLGESAAIGIVLSLVFPTFHWAMGWAGKVRGNSLFDAKSAIFSICVGLPCAILFAFVFGRRLMASPRSSK